MKIFYNANRSYIISSLIFSLVFSLIFILYQLEIRILIYGLTLYLSFSLIITIYRYIKFKKIYINLEDNMYYNMKDFDNLVYDNSLIEKKYLNIIKEKNEEIDIKELEFSRLLKEQQEYLALWVHQVKTPIASIELFTNREESKTNKEIKRELLKANEYINQMINYMKLNKYSEDYVFKNIELQKVVNNSIKKYKLIFFQKKLFINVDIGNIKVISDEKWLNYIFQQIIFNSLKYTETGGIKIYTEKENPFIIHFVDTGIGIPEVDLNNITKWGYTGENGRLDKNSTGIGLYLVDKILKNFNYDYKIKSEVGKGTEFIINLKRKEVSID